MWTLLSFFNIKYARIISYTIVFPSYVKHFQIARHKLGVNSPEME